MPKRKHRLGDRHDARRVRTLPPMQYVAASIMGKRNDSQNLFQSSVDCAKIDGYIREKREAGLPGFGFMHLLVAAYIRAVSQKPALNRYIAGWKIFTRDEIILSMMVKKELKLNAQESAIKVRFSPTDTAEEVYRKMEEKIAVARQKGDANGFDVVSRFVNHLPAIFLHSFVSLMQMLDFFGILPRIVEEASPFHSSIFITNLGSLGIQPIYHHLYNFGNTPLFIAFGAKQKELVLNEAGTVEQKNKINYTVVMDERITDGHYLSTALKLMEKMLNNPSKLDTPPETVIEDIK